MGVTRKHRRSELIKMLVKFPLLTGVDHREVRTKVPSFLDTSVQECTATMPRRSTEFNESLCISTKCKMRIGYAGASSMQSRINLVVSYVQDGGGHFE